MKYIYVTALVIIAVLLTTTTIVISPASNVSAKRHHHLTDTQKEDSTASDSQGRPCTFGPSHDECRDQFLQEKGFAPLKSNEHFGECQPAPNNDLDCEILNDSNTN